MGKKVLGYWYIRGVCESIRYLLHYVEEDFEDKRYYEYDAWRKDKYNLGLDFPNLPYLFDGDVKLTQSTAILRYLARKFKLIGENEDETIRIEMAEQQFLDLRTNLMNVCYGVDYEKLKAQYLTALPEKLQQVSKFLGDRKFVLGEKITYVDFLLYEILDFNRLFNASSLDEFENLKAFLERFESLPAIEKYMKSGKFSKFHIFSPFVNWSGPQE